MYDVIIIGAGPAGASAALFTAKAGKKTLLVDSDKSLTKRAWVENHYGVDGIEGPTLLETGKKQAVKHGAEFVGQAVTNVEKSAEGFTVETEGQSFETKHVLLATGVLTDVAEKLGVTLIDGTEPRIKTIVKVDNDGKTGVDGVWAAGTVAGVSVHTIITAGHGAAVAINIISELNGERYVDHDLLS
ncbi:FAD-dependent oxidoreductase [Evansella cellulosilytica]|uniref:FAD-dependent pyridine nucleotide-disulfide oxidoreductase n=1 Tax=Evansella cellulosilytica (strain ATCC 21833 / DSM 2522 / FERM P-1141 / JCM 9156 / N-4) TaxID=649639 RepID=E6TZC9_EVAC2|nr:FAD-dependent oxidoreductase [Evansella cellulosilytica]ADU28991.1 FAD-dependent pyridine nucleotide-disulfide oxidoreductase [Evansella cellulosilytica DSM 2522]